MLVHLAEPSVALTEDLEARERAPRWSGVVRSVTGRTSGDGGVGGGHYVPAVE